MNPRSIATLLVHRPTAKMNDTEVERQIHQMVSFIKQEAEEKASEIRVEAEEEFNIEKLQMVEEERRRVKKEYERKGYEPDAAIESAKRIEREIAVALDKGVPKMHPKMVEADAAAVRVREEEGFRKRQAAAEKRKADATARAAAKEKGG